MNLRQAFGVALMVATMPALADRFPPVANETTQAECSACHLAYPAALLPARSWKAILRNLDDHFGENAQLDAAALAEIESYLVGNAGKDNNRMFKNVAADSTPMRITTLRWFERKHSHEISPRQLERAGSLSNCAACHQQADMGYFEDD
jgi:hypothetical protein